jgi:hypothetical protein
MALMYLSSFFVVLAPVIVTSGSQPKFQLALLKGIFCRLKTESYNSKDQISYEEHKANKSGLFPAAGLSANSYNNNNKSDVVTLL